MATEDLIYVDFDPEREWKPTGGPAQAGDSRITFWCMATGEECEYFASWNNGRFGSSEGFAKGFAYYPETIETDKGPTEVQREYYTRKMYSRRERGL